MKILSLLPALAAAMFFPSLAPCSEARAEGVNAKQIYESDPLNTKEAIAYYVAHPQKFIVKGLAEVPQDLQWQEGGELSTYADPRAKRGGRLIVRMESWPMSFRPFGVDRMNGSPFWFDNGTTIPALEMHPDGKSFTPGFARQWAISKDKRSLFLRLDPEAQFTPSWLKISKDANFPGKFFQFPAEKLSAFNLFYGNFLLSSGLISDPTLDHDIAEQLESLTYYADDLIEIRTKQANLSPEFSAPWLVPALPRQFYSLLETQPLAIEVKYLRAYQWSPAPNLGPYVVESPKDFSFNQFIRFKRLPHWWGDRRRFLSKRFNPDTVKFVMFRDYQKALTLLKYNHDDAPDFMPVENGDLADIDHDAGLQRQINQRELQFLRFSSTSPFSLRGLYLNSRHPLFANPEIRRALALSINTRVLSNIWNGEGERIQGFRYGFKEFDSPRVKASDFDAAKAREIFASQGFVPGPDGIFQHPVLGRLSVTVTTFIQIGFDKECLLYKQEATKAGVEIVCEILEKNVALAKIFHKNFQVGLLGPTSSGLLFPDYSSFLHGRFADEPDSWNIVQLNDPKINKMIDEQVAALEWSDMVSKSQKIQEEFAALNYYIPSVQSRALYYLAKARVHFPEGVDAPNAINIFNYNLYWVE